MKKSLICLGICFTIFLTGCASEKKDTEETATQVPTAAPVTATPVAATPAATEPEAGKEETSREEIVHYGKLGRKTSFRKWKFTVKDVKEKSAIKIKKYGAAYTPDFENEKYVCVTVSVKNTGKKADYFLPTIAMIADYNKVVTASLCDGQKQEIAYAKELANFDGDLLGRIVEPGETTQGTIVFQVEKSEKLSEMSLRMGEESNYILFPFKEK